MTTHEVARLLGISYGRLDRWVRAGYIDVPSDGSGSQREWLSSHVDRARQVKKAFDDAEEIFRKVGMKVPWFSVERKWANGSTVRTGALS